MNEAIDPLLFLPIWALSLGFAYFLVRPFFGITVFFAGAATLYIVLPVFFYSKDSTHFPALLIACGMSIPGFWLGLTIGSRFSEFHLYNRFTKRLLSTEAGIAALILGLFSGAILLLINPNVIFEIASYEARIAFQGETGGLAFLLNQVVISLAILTILCLVRSRYIPALILSMIGIGFAFYSNHKLSLLTTIASWFAWLMYESWMGKKYRYLPAIFMVLLPIILPITSFYSVYRGAELRELSALLETYIENLGRLGDKGILVGDFDGPYRVLITHLDDTNAIPKWGKTYIDQLPVLFPRAMRGNFMDLTENFAVEQLGESYQSGMGFSYSPWAEGYTNFRMAGFFIEAFLFGLLMQILIRILVCLGGLNSIMIFFILLMIVLFQRGYLIGQIKTIIVFVVPFYLLWSACSWILALKGSRASPQAS